MYSDLGVRRVSYFTLLVIGRVLGVDGLGIQLSNHVVVDYYYIGRDRERKLSQAGIR